MSLSGALHIPDDEELLNNVVVSDEEMSDTTFIHHMNVRHPDSLGGLDKIWYINEYVTDCWRAFHYRLHKIYFDLEHEHEGYNA